MEYDEGLLHLCDVIEVDSSCQLLGPVGHMRGIGEARQVEQTSQSYQWCIPLQQWSKMGQGIPNTFLGRSR